MVTLKLSSSYAQVTVCSAQPDLDGSNPPDKSIQSGKQNGRPGGGHFFNKVLVSNFSITVASRSWFDSKFVKSNGAPSAPGRYFVISFLTWGSANKCSHCAIAPGGASAAPSWHSNPISKTTTKWREKCNSFWISSWQWTEGGIGHRADDPGWNRNSIGRTNESSGSIQ